ncbi:MAG TPA: GntR family transcriptional regulator [Anaerolineales bacterium]
MFELTKIEGIPMYVWIREALRKEITGGVLKRGEKLPSEHDLASKFGVSRMTVRHGIAELIDEGLLYRRHGVGTFVAFPHLERDHTRLTNFFDRTESEDIHAQATVLDLEVIPAKQKIAKALDITVGELVIRVKTLRFADNVPITIHDAHIPHKLFSKLIDENLEVQNLWSLFEQSGYKVKRAIQRIEAKEATKELAKLLGIREGASVLYKERTVYADDGTPVEFTYCYNRGDIYSLTVSLER